MWATIAESLSGGLAGARGAGPGPAPAGSSATVRARGGWPGCKGIPRRPTDLAAGPESSTPAVAAVRGISQCSPASSASFAAGGTDGSSVD